MFFGKKKTLFIVSILMIAPTLGYSQTQKKTPQESVLSESYLKFLTQEKNLRSQFKIALASKANEEMLTATKALAEHYVAKGFHAEAAQVWAQVVSYKDTRLQSEDLLGAYADSLLELARYEDVVALFKTMPGASLKTIPQQVKAMTALGHYRAAYTLAIKVAQDPAFVKIHDADFLLSACEASALNGDSQFARTMLLQINKNGLSPYQASAFQYVAALIDYSDGNTREAYSRWRTLSRTSGEPWSSRAYLQGVSLEALSEGKRPESIIALLEMRTDERRFQLELASLKVNLYTRQKNIIGVISALRSIIDFYPDSDRAQGAAQDLTGVLPKLFEETSGVTSVQAAQVFYENIEFAPSGAEGDAMIRDVAGELVALDLIDSAAELLEHQTFQRLRGGDRATVAADLADLYLSDGRPSEALRVLRSTRITGMDDALRQTRFLLEAKGLEGVGKTDAALTLLGSDASLEALQLKARIFWKRQDWPSAAEAYKRILKETQLSDGTKASLRKIAFVRAGVALTYAGKTDELSELIVEEASLGDGNTHSTRMINALGASDNKEFSDFIKAYRDFYSAQKDFSD